MASFGDGVEVGWRLERVDVQSGHLHIALTREAFCDRERKLFHKRGVPLIHPTIDTRKFLVYKMHLIFLTILGSTLDNEHHYRGSMWSFDEKENVHFDNDYDILYEL